MISLRTLSTTGTLTAALAVALLSLLASRLRARRQTQTTPLRGPPRTSLLYGVSPVSGDASHDKDEHPSAIYTKWKEEYGSIIRVPTALGGSKIVLLDPRAVSHFYSGETWTYQKNKSATKAIGEIFGKGLLWAEGDAHKRQRKALSPGFSVAAIRRLTAVFFDSVYKAKVVWDQIIEASASDEAVIEVQNWMDRIAFDSLGIAGFSHDFNTLTGLPSSTLNAFSSITGSPLAEDKREKSKISTLITLASFMFPVLVNIPTEDNKMRSHLRKVMSDITNALLTRTRSENSAMAKEAKEDQSMIGLLIKAENREDGAVKISPEEVHAQTNILMLAGYETTSSSLTWALIELCRHEDIQTKLREELVNAGSGDPTYDQMMNRLPFLDAIAHEVLRLYPPIAELIRQVTTDQDIIPLSKPYTTATGQVVSSLVVKKGDTVAVPIRWFNRCEEFWGPDAAQFNPDRWLDENRDRGAKEITGHRRLLSFSDGARICPGRQFALSEIKAVLSTLIKSYEFRFKDGKDTKIGTHPNLVPRPKIIGEEGARVPLVVKRLN